MEGKDLLSSLSHLVGSVVAASDGALGCVKDVLVAQPNWRLHVLVLEGPVGSSHGELMIATQLMRPGFTHEPERERTVVIDLTGEQVMAHPLTEQAPQEEASLKLLEARLGLHSATRLIGANLVSSEAAEMLGSVRDLVFDEMSLRLRYLVVDTAIWWPGGRRVLIGLQWVQHVNWPARSLRVGISRDALRQSPAFEEVSSIHREFEIVLHTTFNRIGYWVQAS